jgi:plastocyanin
MIRAVVKTGVGMFTAAESLRLTIPASGDWSVKSAPHANADMWGCGVDQAWTLTTQSLKLP